MNAEKFTKHEQQGYRLAMAWLELGEHPTTVRSAVSGAVHIHGRQLVADWRLAANELRLPVYARMAGCELAIEEWEARQ